MSVTRSNPSVERGTITSDTVPAMFRRIGAGRQSGILELEREGLRKSVTFREGRVQTAASTDRDDRFCVFLLTSRAIDLQTFGKALEVSLNDSRRLGEVLVEMEALAPAAVRRYLGVQFETIIDDVFAWQGGTYAFYPRELQPNDVALDLDAEAMVARSVRRQRFWARIAAHVGGPNTSFVAAGDRADDLDRLELTDDERALVERASRPVSLIELCEESKLGDYEVARTVWMLAILGVLIQV